jgi:4-amino-4-deoxy-L-arabinose transferase-like glycosyltransferase
MDLNPVSASPGRMVAESLLAAMLVNLVLLSTSPGLPMAWDEGYAIRRAEGIPHGRWDYTTRIEGHPAFSGMLIAGGQALAPAWFAPLTAARLGPILFFALACGGLYYRLGRDDSRLAAWAGVAALLLLPRLFAHAHFAAFDGPLTSAWVLAWVAFVDARLRPWAIPLLGIALGIALATKITGWLAPVSLLAWTALYRDRPGARALAIALPMALAVFYLLNPPLWHAPLQGLLTFFHLNLHRAANPDLNISTQFLGRMYDLEDSLPWYNTLFWTAVTVPLGILLLALVGLVDAVRHARSKPLRLLVVGHWLVLLVVRALPGVPPHDGERLFLPAFAILAVLAAIGCHRLRQAIVSQAKCYALLAVLYLAAAGNLVAYSPQWLSYYNLAIGGLRGAAALGMEPTYYWDSLDRSVLDWLHAHTPADAKIHFAAPSWANLELMRRWGTLQRDYQDHSPGQFAWHVVQRRPSAASPAELWLFANARPAFRKSLGTCWLLNTPLLDVYAYPDYLAAERALARVTHPGGMATGD